MSKKKDKAKKKSEEHKRLAAAKAAVDAGEFVTVEEFIEVEKQAVAKKPAEASEKKDKPAKKKKKTQKKAGLRQAGTPEKPSLLARLGSYFKGVLAELKRVVWPTRKEVVNSTIIVLVTLVFFGIFAFIVDWLSTGLMDILIGLAAR